MKNKTKQEHIKLTDGRIVLRGPWIQESDWSGVSINVGVYAINQETLKIGEEFGDSITILKVKLSFYPYGIKLPTVEVFLKELWSKELIAEVIHELEESCRTSGFEYDKIVVREKSDVYKRTVKYAINKLTEAFEKEKELVLEDGRRLVGDLKFSTDWYYDTLKVWGDVKDMNTQKHERLLLFTIEDLCRDFWSVADRKPTGIKNKEAWCKKLELLVISYLNLLTNFAASPLNKQIAAIAENLSNNSEWSVICRKIYQKLLSLPPEAREDRRIAQILELIKQVSSV